MVSYPTKYEIRIMHTQNPDTTRLSRFINSVITPDDSDEMRWKKQVLLIAATVTPVLLISIGGLYLAFNEPFAGLVYVGFSLYIWLNAFLFSRIHRSMMGIFWAISIPVLPLHLLIALSLGNFINSGAILLWGLAFPLVPGLIFVRLRQILPFLGVFIFNIIVTTFLQPVLRTNINLPPVLGMLIFTANLVAISVFIMSIMAYFIQQRDIAFQLLKGEQVKTENLLLNILPGEIAAILKNENRTIADHFEKASILFADVVNFTPLSANMSPVQLVELLNEIFSHFDLLVEKYGLEKIKTIGDCYMVASGVPRHRPDHAQALVHMALEMQSYIEGTVFRGQRLNFRMGINSGAVVAGVIGRKKFIYDLWGDAVNTASRMESHGAGGTIQITEATYELIRDDFECEPKGLVNVKGKGEMSVWTVLGAKSPQKISA